ncbi:hypothetical protein HK098_003263 [Nowakowskiella sp. JEL0407]|nr:hypothetical protein HK098_003263 [Nowakowskiella sp. JEL0407]
MISQHENTPNLKNQPSESSNVIMICRNKHYPYIASYHGPWLTLPTELLQSLLSINEDDNSTPPIDPVIFRKLIKIRELVDEASDLVIKISSGDSGGRGGGWRGGNISAVRQQRLRELAVSKLAKAYKIDEIATSVLTMQSASTLDDVALKVLKKTPNNLDAVYVHFFHEKIPSRMLSSCTTSSPLDLVINHQPNTPEFYRTRAMIKCFREEFKESLRDFKTAITLAKKRRRAECQLDELQKGSKCDEADEEYCCENQLYFLRAACYHQYAISILDSTIKSVTDSHTEKTGAKKVAKSNEKCNATLLPSTAYHASDIAPAPMEKYRMALKSCVDQVESLARKSIKDYSHFLEGYKTNLPAFLHPFAVPVNAIEEVNEEKSKEFESSLEEDSELTVVQSSFGVKTNTIAEFISQFPTKLPENNLVISHAQTESHASCNNKLCKMASSLEQARHSHPALGTYHPLLVESWHAIGLNYFLLLDFKTCLQWQERITKLYEIGDGYPIFLTARSMSQADYVQVVKGLRKSELQKSITEWKKNSNQKSIERGPTAAMTKLNIKGTSEPAKNGAGDGGKDTKTRQYPLHTKRAETILVWIQSMLSAEDDSLTVCSVETLTEA